MTWTYTQSTGELAHNGEHVGTGYSGHGDARNDPRRQTERGTGPIPCGAWAIEGPPIDTPEHGPFVLHLTPKPGTETFNRSGFLIHGDSVAHPGEASLGCIIMPRPVRMSVWGSGDRDLVVQATQPASGAADPGALT